MKKKNFILGILLFCVALTSFGQGKPYYDKVQIGGGSIITNDASIDLAGTTQGFLPNRLTTTQRNALTPLPFMLIANTTTGNYEMYNGSSWITFGAIGLTSLTTNSPLSDNGSLTDPTFSISQSNTSTNGYLSSGDWNAFNNKVSNVSTNLSVGSKTATTMDVNSSDGTNATLPEANTTEAGILGSDKWDEIVANTLKVSDIPDNATHTGDVTGSGALTIASKAVDVAMIADGTDGELITWNASGVASTVAVGTATHVLTSNGIGVPPTFQAAAGGGGTTLYSGNSTLSSARIVSQTTHNLTFGTTGEANLFRIHGLNDNIVIGHTAATARLAVTTDDGGKNLFSLRNKTFTSNEGNGIVIQQDDGGSFSLINNAIDVLKANSSGEIGIGTPPVGGFELVVAGATRITGATTISGEPIFNDGSQGTIGDVWTSTGTGGQGSWTTIGGGDGIYSGNGQLSVATTSVDMSDGAASGRSLSFNSPTITGLLKLDSPNDRIGFGVSVPLVSFHFQSTGNSQLAMYQSTTPSRRCLFLTDSEVNATGIAGGLVIRNDADNATMISLGGADFHSYINDGREFGIGITNPQQALDVSGNIQASGNFFSGGSAGLNGTFNFNGVSTGDILTMTFTGGILTGTTTVP